MVIFARINNKIDKFWINRETGVIIKTCLEFGCYKAENPFYSNVIFTRQEIS